MKFDDDSFENLANALRGNLNNMRTEGDPQVNEILYLFQQEILPKIIFKSIPEFFINFRKLGDIVIHKFIENLYEMKFNEPCPRSIRNIHCSIEIINSSFEVIQINVNTQQSMLAKRMYIVSDLTYSEAAYFLSENSMRGSLMFCSVGLNPDGSPRRSNYGPIRDNEIIEKKFILDILSGRRNSML